MAAESKGWFRRARNNPAYEDAVTVAFELDGVEYECVANMPQGVMAIFHGGVDITGHLNHTVYQAAMKRFNEVDPSVRAYLKKWEGK